MRTKVLGRTGLDVPIVGLGAAFVGIPEPNLAVVEYGGQSGQMDTELGVRAIHAALEAGCTFVDTAPLYGAGRSETIIGRALRERPDLAARTTVTTKVGQSHNLARDFTYDAILRDVEQSQKRLGIEQFQILYIHDAMGFSMDLVLGKYGALAALRKLQKEGVVRFVGSAANDPETNADYLETGEFDAAVSADSWSMLNQLAARRVLPAAEKHDVGIVAATPLERGVLATGPSAGTDYLDRNFSPACLDHVRRIQNLCQDYQISMVATALQWCTRHPRVATTVPGARTPKESAENVRAGEAEIPEAFWKDLEPLVRHWEAGVDR